MFGISSKQLTGYSYNGSQYKGGAWVHLFSYDCPTNLWDYVCVLVAIPISYRDISILKISMGIQANQTVPINKYLPRLEVKRIYSSTLLEGNDKFNILFGYNFDFENEVVDIYYKLANQISIITPSITILNLASEKSSYLHYIGQVTNLADSDIQYNLSVDFDAHDVLLTPVSKSNWPGLGEFIYKLTPNNGLLYHTIIVSSNVYEFIEIYFVVRSTDPKQLYTQIIRGNEYVDEITYDYETNILTINMNVTKYWFIQTRRMYASFNTIWMNADSKNFYANETETT